MRNMVFFVSAIVLLTAVYGITSGQIRNSTNRPEANRITYEYAILTTVVNSEDARTNFTVTWSTDNRDFIGQSTQSLLDAQRRLNAQFNRNSANTFNLSVLLTTLGSDGWRLIETNQKDSVTTRIFTRVSS